MTEVWHLGQRWTRVSVPTQRRVADGRVPRVRPCAWTGGGGDGTDRDGRARLDGAASDQRGAGRRRAGGRPGRLRDRARGQGRWLGGHHGARSRDAGLPRPAVQPRRRALRRAGADTVARPPPGAGELGRRPGRPFVGPGHGPVGHRRRPGPRAGPGPGVGRPRGRLAARAPGPVRPHQRRGAGRGRGRSRGRRPHGRAGRGRRHRPGAGPRGAEAPGRVRSTGARARGPRRRLGAGTEVRADLGGPACAGGRPGRPRDGVGRRPAVRPRSACRRDQRGVRADPATTRGPHGQRHPLRQGERARRLAPDPRRAHRRPAGRPAPGCRADAGAQHPHPSLGRRGRGRGVRVGLAVVLADPAQLDRWRQATQPVRDELAADPASSALLERVTAVAERVGPGPLSLPATPTPSPRPAPPTSPRWRASGGSR